MAKVDPAQYALLATPEHGEEPVLKARVPTSRPVATTCLYCAVMAINGGLVAAFGPSLEPFSRQTGMSMGKLGGSIMQNRIAKLGGTVFWGWYANRLQQLAPGESCALLPHTLMAASLLLIAACCALFGFTKSGESLQLLMLTSGFLYGVTDSAANLMITWVWHHDTRKLRTNVAVLNSMFTVGAFVTPMLIATSMHSMRGAIWPAYYILAAAAILEACILPQIAAPEPVRHSAAPTTPELKAAADPSAPSPVVAARDEELARARHDDSADDSADDSTDTKPLSSPKLKSADATGPQKTSTAMFAYMGDAETEEVLPRYVVRARTPHARRTHAARTPPARQPVTSRITRAHNACA